MSSPLQCSQEFSVGRARLRVDVHGYDPVGHVLADTSFLNYRLADVRLQAHVTLLRPDIVWDQAGPQAVHYDGGTLTFTGPWSSGPLQKAVVAMLTLRMEVEGWHPFHASAVRYKGRTVMFLGGESNHGKSMGQIEACRRGAELISTETTVVDETGTVVMGSKEVYIRRRVEGTERTDKDGPQRGVEKFFGEMPSWRVYEEPSKVDVIIVPAIDGNFDPAIAELIPFERQFQAFHSLQNYFLLNDLLAPGWPMPIVDREVLRLSRAAFLNSFCGRPFFFVRAANPQILMDQVDCLL
jgi:hypothetical protein